mgnify:CR=1 FL=1|jgi:murein DD-endopeptidase MepM/ murein hydrolase activator NlpD
MSRWFPALSVCLVIASVAYLVTDDDEPHTPSVVAVKPIAAPKVHDILHTIEPGETIGMIAANVGLSEQEIRSTTKDVYDLAKLRAGRTITFKILEGADVPHAILYPLDEDTTVLVEYTNATWTASINKIQYEATEAIREFSVESTLWGSAIKEGLRAADIVQLASVFEFDVDFNTELRAGASVRMVVEELYLDGRFAKLGKPLAVRLQNNGGEFLAIHHVSTNGDTGYYDLDGVARKKAFLRSPLLFSRVTSGFNPRRYHPVLKKRRPHNGTDFGAASGTPIRATGSGKVVQAGRNGGHGKFVKIDHPGPYASSYSHMNRIKVKKGQHIKQGQVIGTVGSTGMSTGPHLHYQFWKAGKFVNPMTIKLPRTQKLSASELTKFKANRSLWVDFMNGVDPSVAMTSDELASTNANAQ